MFSRRTAAIAAIIGSVAFAIPNSAIAQAQDSGFYIGGSIGQSEVEGDCPAGRSCDFKDTAWKLFAGYKFSRYLAVEGMYGDWGEITERGN